MNLTLSQELCELNQVFQRVIEGLKRMEETSDTLPRPFVNGARKS